MREIKFRGWDEENKKWRYGHFFESLEGIRRVYNIVENRDTRYSCSPSSIFQFTGLIDKNGKEIYEGDVTFHHAHNIYCEIVWSNEWACFHGKPLDKEDIDFYFYQSIDSKNLEIVGNIYENKIEEFI